MARRHAGCPLKTGMGVIAMAFHIKEIKIAKEIEQNLQAGVMDGRLYGLDARWRLYMCRGIQIGRLTSEKHGDVFPTETYHRRCARFQKLVKEEQLAYIVGSHNKELALRMVGKEYLLDEVVARVEG